MHSLSCVHVLPWALRLLSLSTGGQVPGSLVSPPLSVLLISALLMSVLAMKSTPSSLTAKSLLTSVPLVLSLSAPETIASVLPFWLSTGPPLLLLAVVPQAVTAKRMLNRKQVQVRFMEVPRQKNRPDSRSRKPPKLQSLAEPGRPRQMRIARALGFSLPLLRGRNDRQRLTSTLQTGTPPRRPGWLIPHRIKLTLVHWHKACNSFGNPFLRHLRTLMLAILDTTHLQQLTIRLTDDVSRASLIDLDVTIVWYAVLFVALILIMPNLVFKPMLARMEERDARTTGARQEAAKTRHLADDTVAAFEAAAQAQKRKASEERAKLREETTHQADAMVQQARKETQAKIEAGLTAQRHDAEAARQTLQADAREIAQMIATKLAEG